MAIVENSGILVSPSDQILYSWVRRRDKGIKQHLEDIISLEEEKNFGEIIRNPLNLIISHKD